MIRCLILSAAQRTGRSYRDRLSTSTHSFQHPRHGRLDKVSNELPEFTGKYPLSGYPDFALLRLRFQPCARLLKLEAIKLYVNRYRDRSISQEEVTDRILDDLVAATRGNVHNVDRVQHRIVFDHMAPTAAAALRAEQLTLSGAAVATGWLRCGHPERDPISTEGHDDWSRPV